MTEEGASPAMGKAAPLQIELDEGTAQGIYANLAMIGHTETEFTMDFIYVQPQPHQALSAGLTGESQEV